MISHDWTVYPNFMNMTAVSIFLAMVVSFSITGNMKLGISPQLPNFINALLILTVLSTWTVLSSCHGDYPTDSPPPVNRRCSFSIADHPSAVTSLSFSCKNECVLCSSVPVYSDSLFLSEWSIAFLCIHCVTKLVEQWQLVFLVERLEVALL